MWNINFNIILKLVTQTRLLVGIQVNSWDALLTLKAVLSDVDAALFVCLFVFFYFLTHLSC